MPKVAGMVGSVHVSGWLHRAGSDANAYKKITLKKTLNAGGRTMRAIRSRAGRGAMRAAKAMNKKKKTSKTSKGKKRKY